MTTSRSRVRGKAGQVLQYMQDNGAINHFEAIKYCNTTCLTQQVQYLRSRGFNIESIPVKAGNNGPPPVIYKLME